MVVIIVLIFKDILLIITSDALKVANNYKKMTLVIVIIRKLCYIFVPSKKIILQTNIVNQIISKKLIKYIV